jgi:hypothetical protein
MSQGGSSETGASMTEIPTIALRAYELWDAAGRPDGRADEFWFEAEEEFRKFLKLEPSEGEEE